MTLPEETRRLGDERDRLDEALDTLAEQLADADAGTGSTQALRQQANELESQLSGVAYLCDEYEPDATVTVRGLAAGPYGQMEDRIAAMRESAQGSQTPGAARNVFAAATLVKAPFLDAEDVADATTDDDALNVKLDAVASQPVGVAKWLEAIGNDLTTVTEGNWKPLSERLAEKSTE